MWLLENWKLYMGLTFVLAVLIKELLRGEAWSSFSLIPAPHSLWSERGGKESAYVSFKGKLYAVIPAEAVSPLLEPENLAGQARIREWRDPQRLNFISKGLQPLTLQSPLLAPPGTSAQCWGWGGGYSLGNSRALWDSGREVKPLYQAKSMGNRAAGISPKAPVLLT